MNWKNWPYWVKGGIIVVCSGVLIPVLLNKILNYKVYFSLLATTSDSYQTPAVFFILIPEWFIYGAIFGYLYGKIKNRKQSSA